MRFTDYLNGKPFYSFLGDNKVNETAETLLELSKKEGLEPALKLVPEDSIKGLDGNRFKILEDRDHFDYIYEVEKLVKMKGGKFETKRKHIRFFKKKFIHEIKILDLNIPLIKNELVMLFNEWLLDKNEIPKDYFKNEFSAFSRFLNFSESIDFFAIGIYSKKKLIAASVTGDTHDMYNLGHFQKSLNSFFKGLNDYLMNELAKTLNEKNIKYMNCEQDLGIIGLRESKESYVPCFYLKKFSITVKLP
ncbi:MAG: phosphatidylglycerol lysyltransferase domain-containing protein [Minisyncoccia bacterium]